MHHFRSPALLIAVLSFLVASCGDKPAPVPGGGNRVGVLIVAHGSDSSVWNGMVETLVEEVSGSLLQEPEIEAVEVAFLTAASPSIADQMREFDAAGYANAIVVPLFLFMMTAGLALVMEHFYWRYYDVISRIFPRKVA